MKKVFITGGAGYVGCILTELLLKNGYMVTVFDLMIFGEDRINPHRNLNIIKGDIRDQKLLNDCTKNHDIIIHLACISNDPSFELNPELGKSINYTSFDPLVKIAKSNGIKKFIYASSSSVYGIKELKNVTEDLSLEPITDYSKFKADCEKILLDYQSPNFITTVVRPATVCGYSPRQRLDVIVNIFCNLAYHKKEITVFGGNQLRPNINIHDMALSYLKIIESDTSIINGEIYNVGFENMSVNDLANLVKDEIGPDINLIKIETEDNRSYHVSSEKIKNAIGFQPQNTIKDAIRELTSAFKNNKLVNTFDSDEYFNIKKMNNITLS